MGERESEIQSLRNLGPRCEEDLNAIGIYCLADIENLGVEQVYRMIYLHRLSTGQSVKTLNAMYLYALHGAIHGISYLDVPESCKVRYKKFAAELRSR